MGEGKFDEDVKAGLLDALAAGVLKAKEEDTLKPL